MKGKVVRGPSGGQRREPEQDSSHHGKNNRHRGVRKKHMHTVFSLRSCEKRVASDGIKNPIDQNRDRDCPDQVADGNDELCVGDRLQTCHVIFLRIFHGVDQRGRSGSGHFGSQQESASLPEQETRDIVHRLSEGQKHGSVDRRRKRVFE